MRSVIRHCVRQYSRRGIRINAFIHCFTHSIPSFHSSKTVAVAVSQHERGQIGQSSAGRSGGA